MTNCGSGCGNSRLAQTVRATEQFEPAESCFRVLVVTTRSRDRLERILQSAAELSSNPQRTLFYGVHLDDCLGSDRAVTELCFRDHRGRAVAMVPAMQLSLPQSVTTAVPQVARAASGLLR